MKRKAGFSLVEVLVAAGLIALIGVVLLSTLSTSMTLKREVEQTSDRYHAIRQTLSRIAQEVSMAYLSKHINPTIARVITGFRGSPSEMTFTAFGNVARIENAKQGDSREIRYYLGKEGDAANTSILRREKTLLDTDFGKGGDIQVVCDDIKEIKFEYWDDEKELFVPAWDSFGIGTLDRLPSRVRVSIVAPIDGSDQPFMTEAQIILKKPIRVE